MKTVTLTKYEANDGRLFDTEEYCREHEREMAECAEIAALLCPEHRDAVRNGGGFIQHDRMRVETAVILFADRLIARFKPKLVAALAGNEDYNAKDINGLLNTLGLVKVTPTHGGMHTLRYYQDRCSMWFGPYADMLCRLNCIDFDKAREFDQPYYVTHQHEVTGGQVNV
jgi:hypothetical protein